MATIFSPLMPMSQRIVSVAVATLPLRMVRSSFSIGTHNIRHEAEIAWALRLFRNHRAQGLQLARRQAPRGALLPQRRALRLRRGPWQRLRGAASAAEHAQLLFARLRQPRRRLAP